MTKQALEKLNDKQIKICITYSALIDRARKNNIKDEYERNSGKLRGFLECLCQMEIISGTELKALYLWFFEKNRKSNE